MSEFVQGIAFESSVNSQEYQTYEALSKMVGQFESSVNSQEYQTVYHAQK